MVLWLVFFMSITVYAIPPNVIEIYFKIQNNNDNEQSTNKTIETTDEYPLTEQPVEQPSVNQPSVDQPEEPDKDVPHISKSRLYIRRRLQIREINKE